MPETVSRTRGLCKAAAHLASARMSLESLLDLDEFPLHREQLRRSLNILRALTEVREADRRAGLHRGGEPHVFAVVPADDDFDDEVPVAVRPFPVAQSAG